MYLDGILDWLTDKARAGAQIVKNAWNTTKNFFSDENLSRASTALSAATAIVNGIVQNLAPSLAPLSSKLTNAADWAQDKITKIGNVKSILQTQGVDVGGDYDPEDQNATDTKFLNALFSHTPQLVAAPRLNTIEVSCVYQVTRIPLSTGAQGQINIAVNPFMCVSDLSQNIPAFISVTSPATLPAVNDYQSGLA